MRSQIHDRKSSAFASNQYDVWKFGGYYDPTFCSELNAELTRIGNLASGWDGHHASPISPRLIANARQLVEILEDTACRPKVVPLATGGLQFEWHSGKRSLEFGIETADEVDFLKSDSRYGIDEDGTISIDDSDELRAIAQWFMEGLLECQTPSKGGGK